MWFPDSALKTAHAMEEFDLEGLPLFILANWRGFSGGQRDLFEGVLQAGSLIVEALRTYRQPVTVYLPPGAELRGGAWVVVDGQINADQVCVFSLPAKCVHHWASHPPAGRVIPRTPRMQRCPFHMRFRMPGRKISL